jgi:hypothetical protein
MHGGLSPNDLDNYYNEQHKKAMNAEIDNNLEQRVRKAGI